MSEKSLSLTIAFVISETETARLLGEMKNVYTSEMHARFLNRMSSIVVQCEVLRRMVIMPCRENIYLFLRGACG